MLALRGDRDASAADQSASAPPARLKRRAATTDQAPSGTAVALGKWLVLGSLAVLWEVASQREWVDRLTLVPLSEAARRLVDLLGDSVFRGDVLGTTSAILASLVLAVALGVPLALLVWSHPMLRRSVEGYLSVYYALPSFALYPVLVVIFGVGAKSLVVLGTAFCTVIVLSQMLIGLDSLDPAHHRLAQSLQLSYWMRLRTMLLPGSRPALRSGVRIASTYALLVVVASEMLVGGGSGLGAFTKQSFNQFNVADTYAGILMIIFLAALFGALATILTRQRAAPWRTAGLGTAESSRRSTNAGHAEFVAYHMSQFVTRWIILPAAGLAIWALLGTVLSDRILPPPIGVGERIWEYLGDPGFQQGLSATIRSTATAAALAVTGGLVLAFLVSGSRYLLSVADDALLVLNGIPKILLYPLFLGAFGLGATTVVTWSALAGSIPMALCVLPAISNIEDGRVKLGRSLRLTHPKYVRAIALPSVAPQIMTGARMAFSLTFIHVIFAEMFGAREGLGVVLANEADFGRLTNMLAITAVIGLVALLPSALLVRLETYVHQKFSPATN